MLINLELEPEDLCAPTAALQSFTLGAGHGTRLEPLTHILPKPLMPLFGKPLVHHILEAHHRAGVREFIINTSPLEYMWDRAFPEGTFKACPVHLSHEPSPLDSGGGLRQIMPLVKANQPLLVQNGDIISDMPLAELYASHRASGKLLTLALRSVDGKKNVGFNPETGLVTDIRHALGRDAGSYQFAGIYLMQPEVAELFPSVEQAASFSIIDIWLKLVQEEQVSGYVCNWAAWHEIGSPAQYLQAVRELNCGERIHPTARIEEGAHIGEDCCIGQDARIAAGVHLEDCIVWPRTHVTEGQYSNTILTPRINITP